MNTKEMSLVEVDLKFFFLIENGIEGISSDMSAAYANIQEYIEEENLTWIEEKDIKSLIKKVELTKKTVFILDSFDGQTFNCLRNTKALKKVVIMGTEEMSFKELDLKFYFIMKEGLNNIDQVSTDLNAAYANIREYVSEEESIMWLKEDEVRSFAKKSKFTKKSIFVLESFDGSVFEFLKKTKALIIGPRCMLSCLIQNCSVPLGTSPVFTVAMRNLMISASGLPLKDKETIKNLVQWMGGYYSDDLNGNCTHLVSVTVKSEKYEKAALRGMSIMHPDWVHDVWSRSRKENITATAPEFNKHKLPIFYSLIITTSGLANQLKNSLVKLVNENGGHFNGQFKSSQTDVLITEKDKTDSQKYRAAIQYKKDCLIPDWITDSVKKGYALPTEHYKVANLKVSTPNKLTTSVSVTDFNPDCTQISEISRAESTRVNSTVNETISSRASVASRKSLAPRPPYKDLLFAISTQHAKKAGPFLDGCCIYLTGFTVDEKEKLNKILNVGGAIRYDEMNDKITHCIAGEPTANELCKINEHDVLILTLEWLAESLRNGLPVAEENFIYKVPETTEPKAPEPPSPSSKKTIESMNHSFKKPSLPKTRIDLTKPSTSKRLDLDQLENEQSDFLSQYTPDRSALLPPPKPNPISATSTSAHYESSSDLCTEDYHNLNFFIGCTVHVHDHEEDYYQQLLVDCENAGAKVVDKSFKEIADYVIVPVEEAVDLDKVAVKGKHVVNNIWFEDAIKDNKLVDILYYHEPIPITADTKPLTGMVIVVSLYSNNERLFIEMLAKILGATKEESYAKKRKPLLICSEPNGAKYEAAVKWKYPAVTSHWLVDCAHQGKKVSLEPYLVGESELSLSTSWSTSNSMSFASDNDTVQGKDGKQQENVSDDTMCQKSDRANVENKGTLTSTISPKKANRSQNTLSNSENDSPVAQSSATRKSKRNLAIPLEQLENIAGDANAFRTPPNGGTYLRHRRLSELADSGRNRSRISSDSSLPTPPPAGDLNISDLVMEVSTPNRELLYNVLKEMRSKETPESQRIRKLVLTPGANTKTPPTPKLPDCVTTPEIRKRRWAFLDSYYLPPAKPQTPITPFSEIKKRFWKEALGDQYFEEGNYNTQTLTQIDDDASTSTGTRGGCGNTGVDTQQQLADANIHVKQLSDFIHLNRDASRENGRNDHNLPEFETEAIPQKFDSEYCGTQEMIGWRDPSEISEDTRSKAKGMKFSGKPRFSISCPTETVKMKIVDQIKRLEGEVCENLLSFDETCTHIVCHRPNRGEKILSGIASGKWILDLKYIEDSAEAGYFLDEETYEWGNPQATNLPKLTAGEQVIANAAFRWRTKLKARGSACKGVFQGFNVVLHVTNRERFEKLIRAGGGDVIDVDEPYSNSSEALKASHCFVEQKRKLLPNDHKALTNAGVLVLSIMYLNAHLTSEVAPDYAKYLLSADS